MSAITALASKFQKAHLDNSAKGASKAKENPLSEKLWMAASFVLFLALGPFSAIAAVMGVLSLIPKEDQAEEPPSAY